jgi:peptidoglycan/LPS O-acetylase OafA/YrhL
VFAITAFVGKAILLLFFVWLLGAVIAVLPLKVPRNALKPATASLAILFPAAIVLVHRANLSRYSAEWIVALCFSVLLYLLLHRTEPARASVYKRVADFSSRVSYTLYLVHLPLAVFLCACINTPWHHWDKSPSHVAIFLLLNVVLVSFAYAFYLLFEANTDRVRRILFSRRVPDLRERYEVQAQTEKRAPAVVSEIDAPVGWR